MSPRSSGQGDIIKLQQEFTLNKKLKRRITDLCGLSQLSREERLSRANEILRSTELKQAICHEILGCTHKDVDRAMRAIIDQRQITEEQAEQLELEEMAPEKFDPEVTFIANKHAADPHKFQTYGEPYTRQQVAMLLAASSAPTEMSPPVEKTNYPTMTREECEFLMADHYAYLERERENKKEREEWVSPKTTELEVKTDTKTKRTKSTKA